MEDHVAIGAKKSLSRARFAINFSLSKIFHHKIIEEIKVLLACEWAHLFVASIIKTCWRQCDKQRKKWIDLESYFKRGGEWERFSLSHVKNKREIRMVTEKERHSLSEQLQKEKQAENKKRNSLLTSACVSLAHSFVMIIIMSWEWQVDFLCLLCLPCTSTCQVDCDDWTDVSHAKWNTKHEKTWQ